MKSKNPIVALFPFWLFVFLFKFASGLHYALLSVLGQRVLPIWIVGIIIGGAAFLELCFDVPAGFLMDHFGYVRIMRASTFAFFLGALVLIFHFSTTIYLLTVFFGIIGWLFSSPGIDAYTLAEAPRREGGRYMGIQHVFSSLGVVGASFFLVFITRSSTAVIGITLAIIFMMSLIALARTRKDHASLAEIQARHVNHSRYLRRQFIHRILKSI